MLKRFLASAVLASAVLGVPVAAAEAATAAASTQSASASACTYKRDGNVWRCITPGAYCPAAAHNRYGYDKTYGRRYKCTQYTKTTWRWKRA